ncbi:hypothetical protein [Pseudactinotalea suaedae]|uniref:hypothetical protein n=1 Tax=Pseudactinotalea suaedae TaxID=1524924 RepID=UPI0012E0DAA7|nr:hypothetical protein [Pseudactinotalea suaedae]
MTGEHLQLVSVTSDAMAALAPGRAATWDVGVSVITAGEATVDVSLRVLDATASAFEVAVSRCDQRWTAEGCSSGELPLLEAPVTVGESSTLGSTDAGSDPWYRVTVTMVGEADAAQATLQLTADGVGEELSTGTDPGAPVPAAPAPGAGSLPDTGAAVVGQAALAVAAALTGVALAGLARRRSRRELT